MRSHAATLGVIVFALVGCSGIAAPTPTPGGFSEVIAQLVLRGITVHEHVAGDDGCPTVELHDNAARLSVSLAGQSTRSDVYVFRWRRAGDYAAETDDFFSCVDDFRSRTAEVTVDVAESSPWRAYGRGWGSELSTAIHQALDAVT